MSTIHAEKPFIPPNVPAAGNPTRERNAGPANRERNADPKEPTRERAPFPEVGSRSR